jgi:hypothetical protein
VLRRAKFHSTPGLLASQLPRRAVLALERVQPCACTIFELQLQRQLKTSLFLWLLLPTLLANRSVS